MAFVTRWIVHFVNLNPQSITSTRPETRIYSSRGHAENRIELVTDWNANLVEVIALTVEACEETLEEYR